MNTIKYARDKRAKTPVRANPSDAGLDVFYLGETVDIAPRQNKVLNTGLRFEIPHGYMLQVCNRSSVAAKRELIVGAHIIDSGYKGEVFIDIHNIGSNNQTIENGDKIAQLVMLPIVPFETVEVDENVLYNNIDVFSARGQGALGSTGS